MIKEKQWFNIFIIIGIMFLVFFGKKEVVYADSISTKVEVSCSSYEMSEKNPYKYDDLDITDKMSFGLKSLGKLYVCGKDISQKSFNGIDAYGVSGNASLVYSFDQSVVNASDDKWHLVKDKTKKVNGKKLDSNILGGVILIEKSYSGDNYVNVGSPICDYFNTNKSSNQICTIAGNDISKGVYYRITLAYKTGKKNKDFPWNTKYLRHVEKYDFYIVENSGIISIHNLSADEELIKYKDYSQELLRHGETLEDNSVTRDGFEIESFASSYSVSVQKDNGKPVLIKSGERFTEDGKYKIKVRTKIGKEITKTVYVFKGSEDKGYSTYFGAGLVQAERVFRNDSVPTYARGGRIHIHKVDDSIPILYGTVKMVSDNKAIYSLDGTRSEQAVSLYPGEYIVDLYNGKQNVAGSFYHYIFKFNVIDEESAPYVNYHELSETQQLEDLQSKHYEVVYKTNRGGYVYVCFSIDSYDDALKYAREIEGRYVETVSGNEGGWYYKSEKNPNRKVKYYDEIELTKIREYYAKKNIEINYFNPLDEFTYRTYDNNLLDCLEDLNISDSIKVFPSHEEKNKLTDRAPYLNNFKFIQASKYDVVNVRVKNTSTDEMTDIKFGVSVDKQLKETSKYRIIETNLYGRSKEYDAIYMNECQTRSRWVVEKDNQKRIVDITPDMVSNNSIISIDADSVYVSEIYNIYDKWAIVTIKAPKVYSSEIKCLAAEFKNIELNKGGTYEISFIDRIGNSYKMNLNISGNKEYSNKNDFTSSYTELYNKIYMNNMDEREDYTELPLLVSDNETIGSDDMYNTNDAYETNEKNVEDKANKSKNDEGNHNEKKRNPVVIVFVVIAALIFVFVLKKGKTAKNEEVHKDEKNK